MPQTLNLVVVCQNINVILKSNLIDSNKKKKFSFNEFKQTDPEIKSLTKALEQIIKRINKSFATPSLLNEVVVLLKPFVDPQKGTAPKAGSKVKNLLSGMYKDLIDEQKIIVEMMANFDAEVAYKKSNQSPG